MKQDVDVPIVKDTMVELTNGKDVDRVQYIKTHPKVDITNIFSFHLNMKGNVKFEEIC